MAYWFFLSYARLNKDQMLVKFHEDLCTQVLLQEFMPTDQVGFFDGDTIQLGEPWKASLSNALCTSRLLVCLISPAYSNSDYCGREFQVFLERQEPFIRSLKSRGMPFDPTPRTIFPVLWGPPRDEFPDAIKALQYTDDEFPVDYAKQGLAYLMSLSSKDDDYKKFVRILATRLVAAGATHQMPDLLRLRPLEEVPSAFVPSTRVVRETGSTPTNSRRRYANFVFVAARAEELSGVKTDVAAYAGGGDWQPYLPDDEDPLFILAQEAATKLKLFFHELPLTDSLEQDLKDAARNNEIVMIIVDAWSIQLDSYRRMIRAYDGVTLLNCALLVPLNETDPETASRRDQLRSAIKQVFQYKSRVSQGMYFQDAIPTVGDLKDGLVKTMTQIRADIINSLANSAAPASPVRCEELERDARDKGIDIYQQPAVAVPTGR
jgi:FxsC-like protein